VAAGAQVESAEARIGAGPAGGSASLAPGARWYTGNLAVGAGGPGMILNSGELSSDVAVIGFEGGPNNFVSMIGSTAAGRATWHLVAGIVGDRGEGWLGAIQGGSVNAEAYLQIAARNGSRGEVLVDGFENNKSSELITSELIVGKQGSGTLVITNGGSVTAGVMQVGPVTGSKGIVRVDGFHAGASSDVPSSLHVEGNLLIGWKSGNNLGSGDLIIRNGAKVTVDEEAYLQCGLVFGQSSILVGGSDSIFEVGGTLFVGNVSSSGKCAVILEGSVVRAGEVWVLEHGEIRGVGTLDIPIGARLVSDGGFVSPGLSPGALKINGSFEQRTGGRLLIELGGTNSTAHDQLVVAGDANLDGEVIFRLVNNFTPKAGDRFDFLKIGGARNGSFAKVSFQNVAPGFQFNLSENGTNYGIAALNNAVYDAALPGTVDITITNLGGITYATYSMRTPSACAEIAVEGAFTRSNTSFQQKFQGSRVLTGDCPAEEQIKTEVVVLGVLSPGVYSFDSVVDGNIVKTTPFTVTSAESRTLLNLTRLTDGSVQFEIAGIAPVEYSLEFSEDLKTWDTLTEGTLPATFIDPDAVVLPTRFYRAVIRH
jgi:T5SS/PEP-CTERM-associated repeat protein